jgi:hypothetical protein
VIIPGADQDCAVDFYVNKLGFEKRVEVPFGNGYRWIEVGLGSEATTIALAPPPHEVAVGKRETGRGSPDGSGSNAQVRGWLSHSAYSAGVSRTRSWPAGGSFVATRLTPSLGPGMSCWP